MLNLTQSESEYARTLEETMNSFLNEEPFSNLNENDISAIKEKIRTYFLKKYQEENKERLIYEAAAKPAVDIIAAQIAEQASGLFSAYTIEYKRKVDIRQILRRHGAAAVREIMALPKEE